jgi:hypothetical protein
VLIPVELETSYLHIKTNSEVGSSDKTKIYYYGKEGSDAGGFGIYFTSPHVKYALLECQGNQTPFPPTLPTTVEKVWTIEKRGFRTRVFCNGALLLDITVSLTTCDYVGWDQWENEVQGIDFWPVAQSQMYMIG